MPLRLRLVGRPETLNDFELAAEVRFWEGLELIGVSQRAGGVYLIGYAAEMWLKYACFRFDGAGLADPVDARPQAIRNRWGPLPGTPLENGHSLLFWMEMLRTLRERAAYPLPNDVDHALRRSIGVSHQNWLVRMRYFGDDLPPAEAEEVYSSVNWLRDNRTRLWS